jgi:hypothetical protein
MNDSLTHYYDMSDAGLYSEISKEFVGQAAAPTEAGESSRLGARYFETTLPRIRPIICGSLGKLIDKDGLALATALAELLAGHFQLPPTVASIAVLIARMGVNELCQQAPRE